jgi:hypothetical protein
VINELFESLEELGGGSLTALLGERASPEERELDNTGATD